MDTETPGADALERAAKLRAILTEAGGGVLAYSGGVDSTYLLAVAHEVLGDRLLAVTATSELFSAEETARAVRMAADLGARHMLIAVPWDREGVADNPPDRCYYCKLGLMQQLRAIADEHGLAAVFHGEHADDEGDYRPGARAARECGARAPLREAQLTKADIRALSRLAGLPTWDQPSMACYASRIPYGTPLTAANLGQVAAAEEWLRARGFRQVRVRHHGDVARIELPTREMGLLLEHRLREDLIAHLHSIGFTYIALDLQGFRSGSMNDALSAIRPDQ